MLPLGVPNFFKKEVFWFLCRLLLYLGALHLDVDDRQFGYKPALVLYPHTLEVSIMGCVCVERPLRKPFSMPSIAPISSSYFGIHVAKQRSSPCKRMGEGTHSGTCLRNTVQFLCIGTIHSSLHPSGQSDGSVSICLLSAEAFNAIHSTTVKIWCSVVNHLQLFIELLEGYTILQAFCCFPRVISCPFLSLQSCGFDFLCSSFEALTRHLQ